MLYVSLCIRSLYHQMYSTMEFILLYFITSSTLNTDTVMLSYYTFVGANGKRSTINNNNMKFRNAEA